MTWAGLREGRQIDRRRWLWQLRLSTRGANPRESRRPAQSYLLGCHILRCKAGMSIPDIYADFNGLERIVESPARYSVALDTYGTLRDLSTAGIRLTEGLELLVWDESDESEDLEGEAIARFDTRS